MQLDPVRVVGKPLGQAGAEFFNRAFPFNPQDRISPAAHPCICDVGSPVWKQALICGLNMRMGANYR